MSMNNIYFLMAIHFHQPIGNFNFVFEKVYRNSYQPFIESIKEFPDIKLTLHFTGCLLEWLGSHQPKYLDEIRNLVKRGQVEIMTGGFYEPILPVIPYCDQLGQIAMLSEFVKKNFHYDAKGAWIAERVWEPNLPLVLNKTGVRNAQAFHMTICMVIILQRIRQDLLRYFLPIKNCAILYLLASQIR
jgi:alpha-amylase